MTQYEKLRVGIGLLAVLLAAAAVSWGLFSRQAAPTVAFEHRVVAVRAEVEADIAKREAALRAEIDRRFTLAMKEVANLAAQPANDTFVAKLAEAERWQAGVEKRLAVGEEKLREAEIVLGRVDRARGKAAVLVEVVNALTKYATPQQTLAAVDAAMLKADVKAQGIWSEVKNGETSLEALLWRLQGSIFEAMLE